MQGILFPHTDVAITIEMTEDMLGTVPKNKSLYTSFIAEKMKDLTAKDLPLASGALATEEAVAAQIQEEIETVEHLEDKGWTGFHRDKDGVFIYDYMFKGFLCESARTCKEYGLLKQLQDKFKRHVFVNPRRLRLKEKEDGTLERPIRAMTPQGPRVALIRSDTVNAGTKIDLTLTILKVSGITLKCLEQVLSYGALSGLGQWRNGGWGRFKINELKVVHETPNKS